tara:strand:+ start:173 stop:442 length:270 start_codon:yes stop_codon:yes gene_type:complete
LGKKPLACGLQVKVAQNRRFFNTWYANTWYDSGVEGKKADPVDGPTWYGDWGSFFQLTSAVCCAAPSYKGTFGCCTGFPDDETPKKTLL